MLRHISPLPKKPSYYMTQYGVNYNPEWPIRVNVDHILGDEENLSRIPAEIREAQNLPLLLETAVELARRKAVVEPSIVVPQGYQGRVQYLLPICLTDMEQPDLAMTLTIMDGYYLGNHNRNSFEARLKAKVCELCGTTQGELFELHHVRKVKDLNGKERWEQCMIAKRRKTLVVCKPCHNAIHHGSKSQ